MFETEKDNEKIKIVFIQLPTMNTKWNIHVHSKKTWIKTLKDVSFLTLIEKKRFDIVEKLKRSWKSVCTLMYCLTRITTNLLN